MTYLYARRRRHLTPPGNPFKGDYTVINGVYRTKDWNRFWYPHTAEYVYSIRFFFGDRVVTEIVETLPRGRSIYMGESFENYISDIAGSLCYDGTTTSVTIEDFEEFKKRL